MSTLLAPLPSQLSAISSLQLTAVKERLPTFRSTILAAEQRNSYRIEVNLSAQIAWNDPSNSYFQRPGVVANLSGSGAQLLHWALPAEDRVDLS